MTGPVKYLEKYKRELPLVALAFGDKNLAWIYQYFSMINRLLRDLSLGADDPRFALTLSNSGLTSLTIGNRVVAEPGRDGKIRLMMPIDFDHEKYSSASILGYYTTNGVADAKLVDIFLSVAFGTPGAYEAWKQACEAALLSCSEYLQNWQLSWPHDQNLKHVFHSNTRHQIDFANLPVVGRRSKIRNQTNHSQLLYLLITNNVAWSQWMEWNDMGENAFHMN